jgi:ABC-type transporter Mla subunit MlaD
MEHTIPRLESALDNAKNTADHWKSLATFLKEKFLDFDPFMANINDAAHQWKLLATHLEDDLPALRSVVANADKALQQIQATATVLKFSILTLTVTITLFYAWRICGQRRH